VSRGLAILAETRRPGLQALKEVACLTNGPISLRDVAFKLAPRLNAAGRLGQSRAALELLLTEDRGQARELARHLDRLNRERQAEQAAILAAAEIQIHQQGFHRRSALVLADEDWHPGIIGIVAAKLVERYHRPVALLTKENGFGRGSARSVAAFDLFAGLTACQEHLIRFGGHTAAAGFTLDLDRLENFREAFESVVTASLGQDPEPPDLSLDAEVSLSQLDEDFFFHLNRLRPFGPGNPAPTLACLQAQIVDSRVVGQKHLKFKMAQDGKTLTAIAFDQAKIHPLRGMYDVAFTPQFNFYQGRSQPELLILDLNLANEETF
jgi:single-stranded-DNA-specific exonuclease